MASADRDRILAWMRGRKPATMRDVSDALAADSQTPINHEVVTYTMRCMLKAGAIVQQGERQTRISGVGHGGAAKLYAVAVGPPVQRGSWKAHAGRYEEITGDLIAEISGALDTWSRWVRAGRPRVPWGRDAHLALSMAIDRHVTDMEPHERAAVEKTWGLRSEFSYSRHDLTESYDEAVRGLRSFYRVDATA